MHAKMLCGNEFLRMTVLIRQESREGCPNNKKRVASLPWDDRTCLKSRKGSDPRQSGIYRRPTDNVQNSMDSCILQEM